MQPRSCNELFQRDKNYSSGKTMHDSPYPCFPTYP